MILNLIDNIVKVAECDNIEISNISMGTITYERFLIELKSYALEDVLEMKTFKGIPIRILSGIDFKFSVNFKGL